MLPGRMTIENVKEYRRIGLPGVVYLRRYYSIEELEDLAGIKRTRKKSTASRADTGQDLSDGIGNVGGISSDAREEPTPGRGGTEPG